MIRAATHYPCCFFFSSRRRHTRWPRDWSSDVCSSDLFLGDARDRLAGWAEPDRAVGGRSEERRVGKECRYRWSPCHSKKKRERVESLAEDRGREALTGNSDCAM